MHFHSSFLLHYRWYLVLCLAAVLVPGYGALVTLWPSFSEGAAGPVTDALAVAGLQAVASLAAALLGIKRLRQLHQAASASPGTELGAQPAPAGMRVERQSFGVPLLFYAGPGVLSLLAVASLASVPSLTLNVLWLLASVALFAGLALAPPLPHTASARATLELPSSITVSVALLAPYALLMFLVVWAVISPRAAIPHFSRLTWALPLFAVAVAVASGWAQSRLADLPARRLRMALLAPLLALGGAAVVGWVMVIEPSWGSRVLAPLVSGLVALSEHGHAAVWGTVAVLLLWFVGGAYVWSRRVAPSALGSRTAYVTTALLVVLMGWTAHKVRDNPYVRMMQFRYGVAALPGGSAFPAAPRQRCPSEVQTTALKQSIPEGRLVLVEGQTARDADLVARLLVSARNNTQSVLLSLDEPEYSLPNGWVVQAQGEANAWRIVVARVPLPKSKAHNLDYTLSQAASVRLALFDDKGVEQGRWQGTGDLGALMGERGFRCSSDAQSENPDVLAYLQLPPKASTSMWSTNSLPPVKASVELVALRDNEREAAGANAQTETGADVWVTPSCQAQLEVVTNVKTKRAQQRVALQGPDQQLRLSEGAYAGLARQAKGTLLECTAQGVWVVNRSGAVLVDWAGLPKAQAAFTVPSGSDVKRVTVSLRDDGAYLFAAPGAEAGHAVRFDKNLPVFDTPKPQSHLQTAIANGYVRPLSAQEVEAIQDEFVRSHSWGERITDWFRAAKLRRINTDVPFSGQAHLVLKTMVSLPVPSLSTDRPVFYVAKGVAAPPAGWTQSARVLDMNTWQCVSNSIGCPWPKGPSAR